MPHDHAIFLSVEEDEKATLYAEVGDHYTAHEGGETMYVWQYASPSSGDTATEHWNAFLDLWGPGLTFKNCQTATSSAW